VRATGAANGRNPVSIVIPCHRIVGANGALTGYAGGLERKRWLLEHERAAVGAANARNPIAIVVPCHRVIGADGSLTGYAGGLERKQALLELESRAR
jgi:O6-methylguanine-DNA--protein-cysteine methyltransferase